MFLGSYQARVDNQGRLVIPNRLRTGIESGMTLALGVDGCIDAYPPPAWELHVAELRRMPDHDEEVRDMRRKVFGSAFEVAPDKQGRIQIQAQLRDEVGLTDEVVIVGQDHYFEIWPSATYAARMTKGPKLAEVVRRLGVARDQQK